MRIDPTNPRHLIADEGKLLHRKVSRPERDVYGPEVIMGECWYIDGKKLDVVHIDSANDFEEVDNPELIYDSSTGSEQPIQDTSVN